MEKQEQAKKIINEHVLWSMGGGLIPIPLADLAAVTALQMGMLEQLSELYGVKQTGTFAKTFVSGLTGTAIARFGASLLKVIPGIGTAVGGLAMVITSGASTYALGHVAMTHFANGGTLNNIDMDAAKKAYDKAFEEGKDVAAKMKKKADKKKSKAKK